MTLREILAGKIQVATSAAESATAEASALQADLATLEQSAAQWLDAEEAALHDMLASLSVVAKYLP